MNIQPVLLFLCLTSAISLSACAPEEVKPTIHPAAPLAVEVEEALPYTSELSLNIYSPEMDEEWPVVILLHGGGDSGRLLQDLSEAIASLGAVVFTPDWHSNPPKPAYITLGWVDVSCVLRFANRYAKDNNVIDPRVVVIEHSAGGASGFVATVAGGEFSGDCAVQGDIIPVDGFVGLDGAYNILDFVPESKISQGEPAEWERLNPYQYLDESHFQQGLEIHLVTGSHTELQKIGLDFNRALVNAGYEFLHIKLPGISHKEIASPSPEIMKVLKSAIFQGDE